jgi:hypothetical protein
MHSFSLSLVWEKCFNRNKTLKKFIILYPAVNQWHGLSLCMSKHQQWDTGLQGRGRWFWRIKSPCHFTALTEVWKWLPRIQARLLWTHTTVVSWVLPNDYLALISQWNFRTITERGLSVQHVPLNNNAFGDTHRTPMCHWNAVPCSVGPGHRPT